MADEEVTTTPETTTEAAKVATPAVATPAAPKTDVEVFNEQTAGFKSPAAVQEAWKLDQAAIGNAQPTPAAAEPTAEEVAAKTAEDTDAAAAAAIDGAADPAATPAAEGELPSWLKERVARVSTKEDAVSRRETELAAREQEIADREAAVAVAALEAPDPDDFQTVAAYEKAKENHARQVELLKGKKPAAEPAKDAPAADPQMAVLGLTKEEISSGVDRIIELVPKAIAEGLQNAPALPAALLMEIADQPTKEQAEHLSRFVIGNPKTIAAIAKLPARQQAAALVRAAIEKPPATAKLKSGAPTPIDPVKPNATGESLSASNFADFERRRNAEEIARNGRA